MKKSYSAPEILFESFVLSTNIAGDCDVKTNTPGGRQCGVDIGGGTYLFTSSIEQCNFTPPIINGIIDFNGDKLCYHVPVDMQTLFNS